MASIVTKLNLNKTPQLVDNNSMIFAKNIKLLKDKTIGRDNDIINIPFNTSYFVDDIQNMDISKNQEAADYYRNIFYNNSNFKIVGIIPYNNTFYLFLYDGTYSVIVKYDEAEGFDICNANWHYNNGTITGQCVINLNSDILLIVAESGGDTLQPIKTINLTESSYDDDESFYTQTPNVNIYNLEFVNYYDNVIPSGVYQFFIRYEIHNEHYTDWFPASREIFTGTHINRKTNQGELRYVDIHTDSNNSFILKVDKELDIYKYKNFQIGFILSHDDEVYARSWKKFDNTTDIIYFDYDTNYIKNIDINDLLKATYNIYDVKNVTAFKNKIYTSNYIETDFNKDFTKYAKNVNISLQSIYNVKNNYLGYNITSTVYNDKLFIDTVNGTNIRDIVKTALLWDSQLESRINNTENYITESTKTHILNSNSTKAKPIISLSVKREINTSIPSKVFLTINDNSTGRSSEIIKIREGEDITSEEREKYGTDIFYAKECISFLESDINDISAKFNYFEELGYTYSSITDTIESKITIVNCYRYGYVVNGEDYFDNDSVTWYTQTFELTVRFNTSYLHLSNTSTLSDTSLLPYQSYNFYIHYVKANGEYTNGYLIGDTVTITPTLIGTTPIEEHHNIYPVFTFTDTTLPHGYAACFISIINVGNKVYEVFNIGKDTATNTGYEGIYVGSCIELDTRLCGLYDNIKVIKNTDESIISVGNYLSSNNPNNLQTFGGSGVILFDKPVNYKNGFIIVTQNADLSNAVFTRCTPTFIPAYNQVYDKHNNLNLLGYVCKIYKLNHNFDKFVSGTDLYIKSVINTTIQIQELAWNGQPIITGIPEYIYSNYNLNYLTIDDSTQVTPRFATSGEGKDKIHSTFIATDSSLLSDIYKLPSMYQNYTKKTYIAYKDYSQIEFNNTIRSSLLSADEAKTYIIKFEATDYYNVPTDKGIITNMVAVGTVILVHTVDSMYKFSGANSLTAQGGETVQLSESDVFDTGISEVFGSEFGYAGLQYKNQHTITEPGYVFFDSDSKIIYTYSGEGQITQISEPITKLLNHKPIKDIIFANDFYNDRIFVEILFTNNTFATLSFNFNSKSFISLHDFTYDYSFHTKTNCYLVKNNKLYLVTKDNSTADYGYGDLTTTDKIYPYLNSFTYNTDGSHKADGKKCSIIDIVYKENYETIKILEHIDWVCNKILRFNTTEDFANTSVNINDNIGIFNLGEEQLTPYAGDYLGIYTDSCSTRLYDIHDRTNNYTLQSKNDNKNTRIGDNAVLGNDSKTNTRILNAEDRRYLSNSAYQYPRYNKGRWTYNYFRNVLNTSYNFYGNTSTISPYYDAQSLIYGKYIVIRFIFTHSSNFKLENLTINITNEQ